MPSDARARELFETALTHLRNGNPRDAITYFTLSSGSEPCAETYFELAKLHFAAQAYEKAEKTIGQAVALSDKQNSKGGISVFGFNLPGKQSGSARLKDEIRTLEQQIHKALHDRLEQRKLILQAKDFDQMLGLFGITDSKAIIAATKRESLRFAIAGSEGAASQNLSQFGGNPHLPDGVEWPRTNGGRPLSFLLQLDLSEVTKYLSDPLLPKHGLLSIFCRCDGDDGEFLEYGDIPNDVFRVLFFPTIDKLVPREMPKELPELSNEEDQQATTQLPAAKLRFDREDTFSDPEFLDVPDTQVEDGYSQFLDAWYGENPKSRVLGNPQLIQGWPFDDDNLQLLFQIDSTDELQWGDYGRLYFFIDPDQLKRGDFSQVRLVLQSY